MTTTKKHPTLEEIMDFVCPDGDVVSSERFEKDFSLISHFVDCENCRKLKDDMIQFIEMMDFSFDQCNTNRELMLKILSSMLRLGAIKDFPSGNIVLSCKGTVSNAMEMSSICQDAVDATEVTELSGGANGEKTYLFNANRISISKEQIDVFLHDDGKSEHSVLLIPENTEHMPMLCSMTKESNEWQVRCHLPEDDYDIVIF